MSTKSTVPDLPLFSANGNHATMKKKLLNTTTHPKNYLTPLGEKIFLDRYAWKDGSKKSLAEGDTVIVCVDEKTRQREIGIVESLDRDEMKAVVRLRDDTTKAVAIEHIDKPLETTPDQTMARIARGIAAVESEAKQAEWQKKFEWLLEDWKFVPGGRIWAGAGTDQELTFYNCYVVPSPHDSRGGIVKTLQQMMEIMSRGGGVGINVSSLRPRYGYVKGVNGRSSGAVSWGGLYSFVTGLIEQGGSRRGALMLICNDWHPDVMEFINSKREAGKITNANISVGISDAFMDAVKHDSNWDLVFPDTLHPAYDTEWNGELETWQAKGYPVIRHKTVKAREMWNQIIESAWASAEPGLWFRDRANKLSNSWYFNQLICTNPCGEQSLPSFGICNLGAVNLAKFVKDGAVEWEMLGQTVRYATRFLDDVIDATPYFFAENAEQQGKERRVGLGVMGLAEMMIRLGLRYGSDEGNAFLDELFKFFASEAYRASADIAAEKGAFPAFDADKFLQSGFMLNMPEDVRATIRDKGARNVTLLTVAPTGTTGTMVSTSTGVEPYYFWSYFRKSRLGVHEEVVDVVQAWRDENPDTELPDYFVTAMDLSPEDHVKVQAVVQKWIDSSISKTCNVPNHYTVEQTAELYRLMYELGCKGGTIYRDGSRDEQVLNIKKEEPKEAPKAATAGEATPGVHNVPLVDGKSTPAPYISPNYTNIGDHKRKRARRLKGATYFVHTPVGKAFVTVNRNGEEEPFEVFANVGKVGSEGAAMSEALGRLISLVLRIPSHITPSERLEMVVDQLGGIGGARSIGFGANRVASLPDALAQVLREDLEAHRQDEAAILLGEADPEPHQLELLAVTAQADLCPECGHASFIRIEGCKKCVSCGHAEC
jgi:ribonucleoside-diphosphate reductase alpha chain